LRLVACHNCHAQYDVTQFVEKQFRCRCGETVENRELQGVDASIHRCGSCGAQVAADSKHCDYCRSEIVRDGSQLSLICPECYGRNSESSRFCTACGVPFRPERIDIEGVELPCPDCGCLMAVRDVGGVGINECPQCNGIWAPADTFDHLVLKACESARKAGVQAGLAPVADPRIRGGNPLSARVQYRKCPVCEAFMQRANFRKRSGVIVDRCHSHGTWLDADELEQIAGFILAGGIESSQEYVLKSELDALRRREAAALERAIHGDSITVKRSREPGFGAGLLGLLMDLLN
jgi:Zn-finger nucleic acid-binding protein